MSPIGMERRVNRSDECSTALRFQLESTLKRGDLEAVSLSNSEGLLVAWAGEDELCEELAAMAPIMAHCPSGSLMVSGIEGEQVSVRAIDCFGQQLYLASLGGDVASDSLLNHSARGIHRILTAN